MRGKKKYPAAKYIGKKISCAAGKKYLSCSPGRKKILAQSFQPPPPPQKSNGPPLISFYIVTRMWSLWRIGKCLSIRLRKLRPMLVLTFLLKGGLNQMMLRCLFLRGCCGVSFMYRLIVCYRNYFRGAVCWNVCSSDERCVCLWVHGLSVCLLIMDRHWVSYKACIFHCRGRKWHLRSLLHVNLPLALLWFLR
jgi:hypothetical protein